MYITLKGIQSKIRPQDYSTKQKVVLSKISVATKY